MSNAGPDELGAYWMPFTANRQFKAAPRMLVAADGMYFRDSDGHRILDGTAGLWCVNAGHRRRPIIDAIARQLDQLDYAPSFQLGHPQSFALAARLAQLMPGDLNHVFFTGSGSESVDTALKIALAYHSARGQGSRTRLIGRERGYHGVGFGGISVGGLVANRRAFGPLLPGVDHLRHTYVPEKQAFCRGQPQWGAELADDLERIIALHGASTIAAVIVEPMAGSTGVLLPPVGYLERLRSITQKHGILLIFDEVITAFGRLGAATAAELLGIVPDILTTAKGLTNGAIPMGAVIARSHVHDALMKGPQNVIELFHGYTYSGHPAACAAALATLDIYRDEKLFERARELSTPWSDAVHALRDARHVRDIRSWGLVAGIELDSRAQSPGSRAYEAFVDCFRRGVLIRVTGDIIALSPPLIVERAQVETMVATIRTALASID